ncbi:pH-sensitive chloride channel 2-like [Homalodisca vitripennis]|uniref:pH-sensitive chloride channel 2-like n=1 Tax=Homalodisca vitripennis TaxID=197043 RepID=UPI001EEAB921|nr:pH-sensitive chloride channel 2-like [Homalodisca vitripennis]
MKFLQFSIVVSFSLCTIGNALNCPPLEMNGSSQYELVSRLTHRCRYDPQVRPVLVHGEPLAVRARLYIYHLQMKHSTALQFKVQMLVQLRWKDERLAYSNFSEMTELIGQRPIVDRVWRPHIFGSNEHESSLMGLTFTDQVISITPHGDVLYSARFHTKLRCETEEGKFPFDYQTCHLIMNNWRYNLSYVVLQWEGSKPVLMTPDVSSLTEFDLIKLDTITSMDIKGKRDSFLLSTISEDCDGWSHRYQSHNDSAGDEYNSCVIRKSSLIVVFNFARKFGFYFWDYYVPSVLLVVTSWGTFWVDPEVVPCRVWLATCTMLGFFGLGVMNDAMPKLTQLKMNDIWFIGCNLFIFLSLAEFAFVNIVHRQETKHIPLKRASSKYILKSSLRTESIPWKRKSSSCPSSPELRRQRKTALAAKRRQQKSVAFDLAMEDLNIDVRMRRQLSRRRQAFAGTHMTNIEMANWIDRRSRILFPVAFIIFNLLFWSAMFI